MIRLDPLLLSYMDWLAASSVVVIIEMNGFFAKAILIGKRCTQKELKQKFFQALDMMIDENQIEIIQVFCRLHHFEPIAYSKDTEADFVIDLDTDRIYKPWY